jgi:ABC-type transport system involved in multi-copper enzyme maturation permease subunit
MRRKLRVCRNGCGFFHRSGLIFTLARLPALWLYWPDLGASLDYSMGRQQIVTLARFTLLEALRTRLPWLFLIALVAVYTTSYFVQQLAITESARMQIVFAAAASRLVAVFVLSLYILTSVVREFNDKGLELTLSFDLPRSGYILGRLAGFMLIAVAMALLAGLPQMIFAPFTAALQWSFSLALELVLMTALSVFCVMTFTQLMPAASFVAGFYLLARTLSAIRLISAASFTDTNELSHQMMGWLVDTLALILPALDRFSQSAWLVDTAADWSALGACALQAALYTTLLVAATMFDFYRRNL